MPGAHGCGTTLVAAGLAALMGALVFGERQPPDATGLSPRDITQAELGALRFRAIGPAVIGGRISDLAVTEQDPRVIYAGAASGGVWKTRDGGHSWTPVFDTMDVSSIGDVTVAPSQPDIVWVGTGEANSRENSGTGNGVYVSEDGARAGGTPVSSNPATWRVSPSIRATRSMCSSPHSDQSGERADSAACFAPSTAAARGSTCSWSMTRQERSMS